MFFFVLETRGRRKKDYYHFFLLFFVLFSNIQFFHFMIIVDCIVFLQMFLIPVLLFDDCIYIHTHTRDNDNGILIDIHSFK